MRIYTVIPFRQISEIENYASDTIFFGILCHVCVRIENDLCAKPFAFKQCVCAVNGVLLNVHCNDFSVFADEFAQKSRVVSASCRCVDANVSVSDKSFYSFVYYGQCVHTSLIPHSRALSNRVGDFDRYAVKIQIVDCGFLSRILNDYFRRIRYCGKARCAEIDIAFCKFNAF